MYIVSETLKDIKKSLALIKFGLMITKCKGNPRNIRKSVRKEKRKHVIFIEDTRALSKFPVSMHVLAER